MDTTKVGVLAAELMEEIAKRYDGAPVKIGEVMLIAEIKADKDAPESAFEGEYKGFAAQVESHCTDERIWLQMGLLKAVMEGKKIYWCLEDE